MTLLLSLLLLAPPQEADLERRIHEGVELLRLRGHTVTYVTRDYRGPPGPGSRPGWEEVTVWLPEGYRRFTEAQAASWGVQAGRDFELQVLRRL